MTFHPLHALGSYSQAITSEQSTREASPDGTSAGSSHSSVTPTTAPLSAAGIMTHLFVKSVDDRFNFDAWHVW